MADLVSSVPGIFERLLALTEEAGKAQNPQIPVFGFALGEYEPSGYVLIEDIDQAPYQWETIGSFAQIENYDICGCATVFSGDSPFTNPAVVQKVLEELYALFQAVVMTPVMSNRDMPILGTTGPSPYLMLPANSKPTFGEAEMGGGGGGWYGKLEWSFHFEALLTPG